MKLKMKLKTIHLQILLLMPAIGYFTPIMWGVSQGYSAITLKTILTSVALLSILSLYLGIRNFRQLSKQAENTVLNREMFYIGSLTGLSFGFVFFTQRYLYFVMLDFIGFFQSLL